MWLAFHERLLMAGNFAKRGITSPCIFCGVNPKIAVHIFLYCPFNLELWASNWNHLVLSFWSSSIASLWGDWRLSNIPHNEVNQGNYIVNTIIFVVWYERNQRASRAKSSSIIELGVRFHLWWLYDNLTPHFINAASRHSMLFLRHFYHNLL